MTNFIKRLMDLDKQISDPQVHQQVLAVKQIDDAIRAKQVLTEAPIALGLLPDQLYDLQVRYYNQKDNLNKINNLLNNVREYLSLTYGIWSLPNLTTAETLIQKFNAKNILELMAGNAYWSLALKQAGANVIATDSMRWSITSKTGAKPFIDVKKFDAVTALQTFKNIDTILVSWAPNFGDNDIKLINAWRQYNPQAHLFFIGEEKGSTNSPEFWQREEFNKSREIKEINQTFHSFDFIDEKFFEIKQ